jgi:hypothetical protein
MVYGVWCVCVWGGGGGGVLLSAPRVTIVRMGNTAHKRMHAYTSTTRACTRAATATVTLGIHPTAVPLVHLPRVHVKAIEPTNLGQGAVHRNDADDAVTPSLTIDLLCVLARRAGTEVTLSSSRTCDQVPIATLPDGVYLVSLA